MPGKRSYDDPCGIARGLDIIGERWALLVVRELLLGPKRFTDLHHGLPNASQNVLSQRLRELTESGVVRRRKLGLPAPALVYELTEWGRELEPVLLHLARWGSRVQLTTGSELSTDSLMIAMKTTFDGALAAGLDARFELRLDEDRYHAEIADSRLLLARGSAERPHAILQTDAATLRSLVFVRRPIAEAIDAGTLKLEGDHQLAEQFVTLFPRPTPIKA